MLRRSYVLAMTSVAAVLAACGNDPVQPVIIVGEHVLARVDGSTLPVLVSATVNCDEVITDGSLSISASLAFDLAINYDEDCRRSGGPIIGLALRSTGAVIQAGSSLRFVLVVPGDTVNLYTGVVSAAAVTMAFQSAGPLGMRDLTFMRP
jgi:hypothetical protein